MIPIKANEDAGNKQKKYFLYSVISVPGFNSLKNRI